MPKFSRVETANRIIPFARAAQWAGLWTRDDARERGSKVSCPFCYDGGTRDPAFRIYPDHGFCFAGCGPFSVVRLLAQSWELTPEEAAWKALEKHGWKPPTLENRWADAIREPEPDRGYLAQALVLYCEGIEPAWAARQYEKPVADLLSQCLGLLPQVSTGPECELWLGTCKKIMFRCLREQPVRTCLL